MKNSQNKQGFVILYAVLLTMVVLAIGLILLNIIARQTLLASIERNSQIAYYAADTGRQCALYWNKQQRFGLVINLPGGTRQLILPDGLAERFVCVGTSIMPSVVPLDEKVEASFNVELSPKTCVRVLVEKDANKNPEETTTIVSSGYNVACSDIDKPNARKVERALRVTTI